MVGHTRKRKYQAGLTQLLEANGVDVGGLEDVGGADIDFENNNDTAHLPQPLARANLEDDNGEISIEQLFDRAPPQQSQNTQLTWHVPEKDAHKFQDPNETIIPIRSRNNVQCYLLDSDEDDNGSASDISNSQDQKLPAYTQRTTEGAETLLALFQNEQALPVDNTSVAATIDPNANAAAIADPLLEWESSQESTQEIGRNSPSLQDLTQVCAETYQEEDTDNEENPPSPPDAPIETSLAKVIYDDLMERGLETLDSEEKKFVQSVKRGANTTEYIEKCEAQVEKFFSVIEEFGGNNLRKLCVMEPSRYSHGTKEDKAFYNQLGGEKNQVKKYVVNMCLVLFVMKSKVTRGKNKGKPYQPSTLDKYLQLISYDWKAKGVLYNYKTDFNGKGEFHGLVKEMWHQHSKKDPSFGTCPNRARAPADMLEIIIKAVRSRVLRPYDDPSHCLMTTIAINGIYVGLRGQKEHSDLRMEQIKLGTFPDSEVEDLAGKDYVGVQIPRSKTQHLGFGKTVIPREKDVLIPILSTPDHDCWNPASIYCFYLDKCHPHATKFYARLAKSNERIKYKEEFGKDIWFCPSGTYKNSGQEDNNKNLGKNTITTNVRALGKLVGLSEEELMTLTGHAFRAVCITNLIASGTTASDIATHVRQSNINSCKPYARAHGQRLANRLIGVAGPSVAAQNKKPPPKPIVNPYLKSNKGPAPRHKEKKDTVSNSGLVESEREELERLRMEKLERENQELRAQLQQQQAQPNYLPPPPHHQYGTYHGYYGPPPPPNYYGYGPPPGWGPPPPLPPAPGWNGYGHGGYSQGPSNYQNDAYNNGPNVRGPPGHH